MSFKDIKGQDKAIQILKEHLKQSHLSSGYLFVGPAGVGKRLAAKILAKTVNCEDGLFDCCDRCLPCVKIEKNQYPDVHIIDALTPLTFSDDNNEAGDSQAIRINHIRQLQKDISLKAYEGKKKVFIIDNAHNLTPAASNALLKILEEPPRDSLIILVSAKPALLFRTVISRCQIVKFYPLARPKLEEVLRKDYSLDEHLAHFLAYFCEGRLGKALELKGTQILKAKNRVINELALGRQAEEALNIKNREEARVYLNVLATWFRDLYLIKTGISCGELINLDRKDELLRSMPRFSLSDLDEILGFLSSSLLYLEQNVNIKLLLSNLREEINYGTRKAT